MPIYTNNNNLPTPLFLALKGDEHVRRSDISVTELIKAPRELWLSRRHDKEIVVDVSDRVWAMAGQMMHLVIEHAAKRDKRGVSEMYVPFDVKGPRGAWKVGCRIDHIDEDTQGKMTVTDWKFVSVWSYIFEKDNGFVKPDYERQMNIYDYALTEPEHFTRGDIKGLQIAYIFRDWKKGDLDKAIQYGNVYPPAQIVIVPVRRWDRSEQKRYINERVALHQEAEHLADEALPVCSAEERWERGEAFAVMKPGRKTALKVLGSAAEARAFIGAEKGLAIEHRRGRSIKCEQYCGAAPFCSFYREMMGGVPTPEASEANA